MMPKRIATNRNFADSSVEYIELHDNGVFYWISEDLGNIFHADRSVQRWLPDDNVAGCSFPVDIDFVREFFEKTGRQFDASKLPADVISYPYETR